MHPSLLAGIWNDLCDGSNPTWGATQNHHFECVDYNRPQFNTRTRRSICGQLFWIAGNPGMERFRSTGLRTVNCHGRESRLRPKGGDNAIGRRGHSTGQEKYGVAIAV